MKRLVFALTPLIVLVALVVLFATNINRDPNYVPSVLINKPAPQTDLAPLADYFDRPGFSTADLKGNGVIVVNVFASWCVPCRDEHPYLMQLASEGVRIYGLNQKDAPDNAMNFLADLGNPYERIGADRNGRASIEWGVYGVPETFVVNNEGVITYKHTGPLSWQSLETSLNPAIEAAAKS